MSLRVAGVFAGYFSQCHYDSWAGMRQVDSRASCDCDIDRARATGLPAYDDLPAMMAEQAPDLPHIILPNVAHATTIRTAVAAELKWIIC